MNMARNSQRTCCCSHRIHVRMCGTNKTTRCTYVLCYGWYTIVVTSIKSTSIWGLWSRLFRWGHYAIPEHTTFARIWLIPFSTIHY